jgi:hypothetical protein
MWRAFAQRIDRVVAWTMHAVLYLTTAAIFLILCANVIFALHDRSELAMGE